MLKVLGFCLRYHHSSKTLCGVHLSWLDENSLMMDMTELITRSLVSMSEQFLIEDSNFCIVRRMLLADIKGSFDLRFLPLTVDA